MSNENNQLNVPGTNNWSMASQKRLKFLNKLIEEYESASQPIFPIEKKNFENLSEHQFYSFLDYLGPKGHKVLAFQKRFYKSDLMRYKLSLFTILAFLF